jgi:hypothetical protein
MDNRKVKTNDILEGIFKSVDNWVIICADGLPLCWPDTLDPKVYSCLEDAMADFDKKAGHSLTTEYSFIKNVLYKHNSFEDYTVNFWY